MRNTWRTSVRLAAALIICLGLTGTASADLLWDQPFINNPKSGLTDNTNSGTWVADDFQLGAAAYITQTSWAGYQGSASPNGFNVRFYENLYDPVLGHNRPADLPANEQYIPIANVTLTPLGSDFYSYEANLNTSFTAAANTHYWFSVQANTTESASFWGWMKAGTLYLDPGEMNGMGYVHRPLPQTQYWPSYYDLTYSLNGSPVPLPGAAWLLGSGLLGLAGWRQLRKG